MKLSRHLHNLRVQVNFDLWKLFFFRLIDNFIMLWFQNFCLWCHDFDNFRFDNLRFNNLSFDNLGLNYLRFGNDDFRLRCDDFRFCNLLNFFRLDNLFHFFNRGCYLLLFCLRYNFVWL